MRPASSPSPRRRRRRRRREGRHRRPEQRLESVETHASLLTSSSAAKDDIAKIRRRRLLLVIETLGETVYKTRPFALGFGGIAPLGKRSSGFERRRGTRGGRQRANEDGKNEIKRRHDRLESVLFQIAVVVNRDDLGKQAVVHLFGQARAIARDCLVLTFSLGNRYCHSLSRVSFSLCVINTFSFRMS